jgi:hypothetical protein
VYDLFSYMPHRSSVNEAVRVQHVFFGSSFVKVLIALRRILQRNDGSIDCPGDLQRSPSINSHTCFYDPANAFLYAYRVGYAKAYTLPPSLLRWSNAM